MTPQALTLQTLSRAVPVSELFLSFQGEGVNLGRRALFLRLMHCNLTCGYASVPTSEDARIDGSMLCDTEYTWNRAKPGFGEGVRHLTPQEIWDELVRLDPSSGDPAITPVDLVVASGGEPLLRQDVLTYLATQAEATGRRMEIETNATITPTAELVSTGVSCNAGLKLATSAVPRSKRIKEDAISAIQASGRARWKFVVTGEQDLAEITQLQHQFGLTEVWLSPEGRTPAEVLRRMRMVADAALRHGWNLTTREHILIWGDQRGT